MKKTLVFVATAALAVACNKNDSSTAPAPKPTKPGVASSASAASMMAPAAKLTADMLEKRMMECNDPAKYAECYDDSTKIEMSGLPVESGVKGVQKLMGGLMAGFPDIKFAPGLVLQNGKNLATVMNVTGTNTGSFMGSKPSGAKMGIVGLREQTFTDDGKKIVWERHVVDAATMAGQLDPGLAKMMGPHRGPETVTMPAAPTLVAATDSQTEKDNLAVVQKECDAWSAKDQKAILGAFADDAVFTDYTMPADMKGTKDFAPMLAGIFKAFPDMKSTCKGWAAGDYVVNSVDWTGTNSGAAPELHMDKPTGKSLSIHDSEIYEIKAGKITHYWRFSNGIAMAQQLGLIPAMPAAPPAPAPGAPVPAPAPAPSKLTPAPAPATK